MLSIVDMAMYEIDIVLTLLYAAYTNLPSVHHL